MSISSSLGVITSKLPNQITKPSSIPNLPPSKIPISSLCISSSFSLFRSISFQRLPTATAAIKPQQSSASSSSSLQPIEDLPPKLQEIIKLFQAVPQPKAKYEQLLFYGRGLPPLDERYKTADNKVQGCVSQVWVRAYPDPEKNIWFEADSDSVLTKGLAALLVLGLSGRPADEIRRVSPDFVTLLGLQQSLTPSRNNGFLNMLRLMQEKARSAADDQNIEKESTMSTSEPRPIESFTPKNPVKESNLNSSLNSNLGLEVEKGGRAPDLALGGRAQRIKEIMERELGPVELEVEDVSYQHAGHAGARGSDDGTHINLRIVSKEFEGKSMVKRHRMVYSLLQDELQSGLHALSIVAKAPGEPDER